MTTLARPARPLNRDSAPAPAAALVLIVEGTLLSLTVEPYALDPTLPFFHMEAEDGDLTIAFALPDGRHRCDCVESLRGRVQAGPSDDCPHTRALVAVGLLARPAAPAADDSDEPTWGVPDIDLAARRSAYRRHTAGGR